MTRTFKIQEWQLFHGSINPALGLTGLSMSTRRRLGQLSKILSEIAINAEESEGDTLRMYGTLNAQQQMKLKPEHAESYYKELYEHRNDLEERSNLPEIKLSELFGVTPLKTLIQCNLLFEDNLPQTKLVFAEHELTTAEIVEMSSAIHFLFVTTVEQNGRLVRDFPVIESTALYHQLVSLYNTLYAALGDYESKLHAIKTECMHYEAGVQKIRATMQTRYNELKHNLLNDKTKLQLPVIVFADIEQCDWLPAAFFELFDVFLTANEKLSK